MNRAQLDKIIEYFQSVSQRPSMYMGAVNGELARTWIYAFYDGLQFFDTGKPSMFGSEFRKRVMKEHGYKTDVAYDVLRQMQQKGAEEKAIVEELFAIEIEVCRQMAQKLDAKETEQ